MSAFHPAPPSPHIAPAPTPSTIPPNDSEPPVVEIEKRRVSPPWLKAVSGSVGGLVEASCLQPIDVIKTRLQLDQAKQYQGIMHCGKSIISTEGSAALWKGLTPFATHLTLKYALRMGTNAVFQTALKNKETGELGSGRRLVAGFGAGVVEALVIVTPFEVILRVLFGKSVKI